ncbi:MAG TPA: hypothetical protein VGI25_08135 [Candidatus Udaeobacter sp.]|jgi:hypothetical protein
MPTPAWFKFFTQIEVVVDQEFLALLDSPNTGQPETTALFLYGTIGIATVVHVTCRTPLRTGVHVVFSIELDNMIRATE